MTGFVLSVILTAIPFWLVMGDVLNDTLTTSIVIMALRGRADRGPHDLLPAHEHEVGGRLDLHRPRLHAHPRRHHAGRLDMGHVPHGPEHDADVAARGAAKALTGRKDRGAGRLRSRRDPARRLSGRAGRLAGPSPRLEARPDRAHRGAGPCGPGARAGPGALGRHVGRRGRVPTRDRDRALARGSLRRWFRPSTELGGGYWVMTPLVRDDGTTVLVNRGFVPADKRDPASWRPRTPEGPSP